MQHTKWKWAGKAIVFGLLFVTLATFATMLLWNHLAVPVFSLPMLTFFQTLGLMVLGRLLTGGFGPRRWRGGQGHHLRERWKNMSPEQREHLMQRWGKRGWGPMSGQENPAENPGTTA